jgi:hypothetical protein
MFDSNRSVRRCRRPPWAAKIPVFYSATIATLGKKFLRIAWAVASRGLCAVSHPPFQQP